MSVAVLVVNNNYNKRPEADVYRGALNELERGDGEREEHVNAS